MISDSLLVEQRAGVYKLTLNRPKVHNAFDDKLIKELTEAIAQAKQDPTVQILVLAANGKNFSAGADLNWMQRMANFSYEENIEDAQGLATLLQTLNQFPKPTIALIQGAALGGAIGLIACCDIVLALEDAYFCFSEVKLGLVPAIISPYVIRAIGEHQARYYFLTAERFNAKQARQLGLVHKIVANQSLEAAAQNLCQQLQANCHYALSQAKELIQYVATHSENTDLTSYTLDTLAKARARPTTQAKLIRFLRK